MWADDPSVLLDATGRTLARHRIQSTQGRAASVSGTVAMYYISKVSLRNIKCLPEELTFTVPTPSTDRPSWTLVLGENGTGKTTILRCMAISLCDEIAAPALLSELAGSMIRTGKQCAEIEVELKSTVASATEVTILTTLRKRNSRDDSIEQVVHPEYVDVHGTLFACGYGSSYGTIGNELYGKYLLMDAVYTLFNYDTRLQNPEAVLFRISEYMRDRYSKSYGTKRRELFERIEAMLMLERGSLTLDERGLRVSGFWGDSVPVCAIGDGHAATLNWICDLLAWTLLAHGHGNDLLPKGVVFLDEIENHLHPAWQREIVGLLSQSFPHVQFIATTQAPLITTGTATLPDGCCRLIRLVRSEYNVQAYTDFQPPHGLRADQVLTSDLFGLLSTTGDDVVQKLERYAFLRAKSELTESEHRDVISLNEELHNTLGTPETRLQKKVEDAITITLRNLASAADLDESAMKLEVRRQLGALFSIGGSEHDENHN